MAQQNNEESKSELFDKYEKRIAEFEETVDKLPCENNRIISVAWKPFRAATEWHMKQCYPLVHGSVLSLAYDVMQLKIKYGTAIEQKLYAELSLQDFFDRLATNRCVVFYQSYDSYLLRNGYNDNGKWEDIGTENEDKPDKLLRVSLLNACNHTHQQKQ